MYVYIYIYIYIYIYEGADYCKCPKTRVCVFLTFFLWLWVVWTVFYYETARHAEKHRNPAVFTRIQLTICAANRTFSYWFPCCPIWFPKGFLDARHDSPCFFSYTRKQCAHTAVGTGSPLESMLAQPRCKRQHWIWQLRTDGRQLLRPCRGSSWICAGYAPTAARPRPSEAAFPELFLRISKIVACKTDMRRDMRRIYIYIYIYMCVCAFM